MKISEIITDKYKLRIEPTVYYDLLADVREAEEKQEPCEDAVSKQGVAKILLKYVHNAEGKAFAEFLIGQINDLPSVNPQKPCKDVISRQAVLDITWEEPSYTDAMNVLTEVRDKVKELPSFNPKQKWIPVSKRLPEDFGTYLITLEGGDVCKCEFNPDFIDEEHENGAFTYYHQYFDQATLGMIDEEEEAVDAIAWMPFEPYKAEGSEKE